ncbi:DUF2513 domain-containing protein [Candidatus Woesearchaeota archaeon]|nr:DUF2513 domain-containing protein [Candidatus Woesearchaeota archaeon]MBW3022322.1 DUF2513 domain-containing protein [Candidatus Woesearchaeota archaeon]
MARRGRPVKSQIRQNIIEILYFLGKGYGYDIYKVYREVFPKVTMRSIYYHLKKGVEIGEIKVNTVKAEKGDYSWGDEAEKTYYALGDKAIPKMDNRVKDFLDSKNVKE